MVAGVARNNIARVSTLGVLDNTFNPNANTTVYTLGKDQEPNLLAGGLFTTMNARIARYFSWIGLNTAGLNPNLIPLRLWL